MSDTIRQMIETMRKSASEIVAAGVPNPDELLEKSYDEFQAAVLAEVDTLQKAAEPLAGVSDIEEPLFKGLGTVGRVANMVGSLASQIANLKAGVDYSGQTPKDDADTPSEEVEMFLDHALAMAELAMRAAVNEHVDIAEDGDDDSNVMVLKSADGADYRVKTELPEELAKFATDPQLLDVSLADLASGILVGFGAPEEGLAKLFEEPGEGVLAKDAPGAIAAGGPPPGEDPNADDGAGDDQDPMGQLNLLGRLLAAAMIQLQSFMDSVGGDPNADAGTDPNADPNADANADPNAATPAPAADAGATPAPAADAGAADGADKKKNPFAKAAPAGDLAKVADPRFDELSKNFVEMKAKMDKLLKHPEAAKALLDVSAGEQLSKGVKSDAASEEEIAAAIDALSGEDKALVLTKMAQGMSPERALRKAI